MPVIRVEKNKNYTVISNYHFQDKRISLKAKGLLSYMLSLPDKWEYSISGLASICKEGPDCIRSTIKELEEFGYISRRRERLDNGRLGGIEYVIRERPDTAQTPEKPILENPTQDVSTEDCSTQDVSRQINTYCNKYIPNQERTKKPSISPRGRKDTVFAETMFNQFWQEYPKRVGKQQAIKAWNRLKPDEKLFEIMKQALDTWKRTEQWQDTKFIPNPATWLNGRRWEDEIPPDKLTEKPKKSDDDYWAGFYHPTPEERAAPPWHGYKDIE